MASFSSFPPDSTSIYTRTPHHRHRKTDTTSSSERSQNNREGMFRSLKNKLAKKEESLRPRSAYPSISTSGLHNARRNTTEEPSTSPSVPVHNLNGTSRTPMTTQSGTTPTRRPKPMEPPPAYSANDPSAPNPLLSVQAGRFTQTASSRNMNAADDAYAFLDTFDTVFLIDDSGSMAGSLWRETERAVQAITPICTAHDADGIDIYFLNAPDRPEIYHHVTLASTVQEIFSSVRPGGATPTGSSLNRILKPYLRQCERNLDATKPLNIIVITDGVPTDDVESVIISAAKKLDKLDAPAWQVGIQFFQVGKEVEARKHLKELDNDLRDISGDDELRDMVDTVPFKGEGGGELTADGILKTVLGAVLKRLDRKSSRELHR